MSTIALLFALSAAISPAADPATIEAIDNDVWGLVQGPLRESLSNPAGCAIKPKPLVTRGFGLMATKVPPPKSH